MKLGACLALLALALNLACSFGHHHFEEIARGLVAAEHSTLAAHSDEDGDNDHHESVALHPCFACLVVTAAAIAATPSALPARSWTHAVGLPTTFVELHDNKHASFEARAPPQS